MRAVGAMLLMALWLVLEIVWPTPRSWPEDDE
jgi:hypothetical protein